MSGRNEDTMGGSSCGTHDNGKMGGEGPVIDEEQEGGNNCGVHEQIAGSNCHTHNKKGGAHDLTDTVGGSYKPQKGGNSCGCGV